MNTKNEWFTAAPLSSRIEGEEGTGSNTRRKRVRVTEKDRRQVGQ